MQEIHKTIKKLADVNALKLLQYVTLTIPMKTARKITHEEKELFSRVYCWGNFQNKFCQTVSLAEIANTNHTPYLWLQTLSILCMGNGMVCDWSP